MSDQFEIAFSFDTTRSMYSCLQEVRKRLREIVKDLRKEVPGIKIAIFAHGDYCSREIYVTKFTDFTNSASTLCNFVNNVEATFGGDIPECYELVLREVQEKLSWTESAHKALVMIGDAVPHEASYPQNTRRINWREEIKWLRSRDIKIYAVQCKYRKKNEYFYQEIASRSFGDYWRLENFEKVKELIMEICFREAGIGSYATSKPLPVTTIEVKTSPTSGAQPSSSGSDVIEDEFADNYGIRCELCSIYKLPDEFPQEPITDKCQHYPGCCMRCVVSHVNAHGRCPQPECGLKVELEADLQRVSLIQATLDWMFLDYNKVIADSKKEAFHDKSVISVSTMNGDTVWITHPSDITSVTIQYVKDEVEKEFGFQRHQQKILYNDAVLKGNDIKLSSLGVPAGASLSLVVPLYCIPEDLDHVVFDLSWQFPDLNPDFLDASCLAFDKTEFIQVIDWNHSTNNYFLKGSVTHSAKNETREGGRFGLQTIDVRLKSVPYTITHLYFTLSSWRAPNLSAFSNPSLRFYEKSAPDSDLCSTTFGHALDAQAVIMCTVVRSGKQWLIYECESRACVNGNAKRYNPIRERIEELIRTE